MHNKQYNVNMHVHFQDHNTYLFCFIPRNSSGGRKLQRWIEELYTVTELRHGLLGTPLYCSLKLGGRGGDAPPMLKLGGGGGPAPPVLYMHFFLTLVAFYSHKPHLPYTRKKPHC